MDIEKLVGLGCGTPTRNTFGDALLDLGHKGDILKAASQVMEKKH